jgi:fluoroacetyl-CoA thioesterase
MKNLFEPGDKKTFKKIITDADTAFFDSGRVHPVYATFALGRDAEWCCRLFVLEMKDGDEEGIGTFLSIQHHAPALTGEEIVFEAEVKSLEKNELICRYTAKVSDRLVASGEQGQKVLKKERLDRLFKHLKNG